MEQTTERSARSVCPFDCPDACSLKVTLDGDRIVAVTGNPDHPVTQGAICNKVRNIPDRVHHPERLMYPLRRVGPKGVSDPGAFERITWEEAYREIVNRMKSAIAEYGPTSIMPYSFYGNMGALNAEGMDRRFFHRLGATQLDRTICSVAGGVGYKYTMGAGAGVDPEETVHAKLILIWGCNLVSTNMHQVMYATEARKRGAKIVHIDVHRNRTSAWADEFIAVRPGTDAALALGMMHVLIRERLINEAYVSSHTVGYDELAAEAALYPPERVADITGVSADVIVRLAREYGTTAPAFIRIGNGLQHHDNGGMAVRTIACLPALIGAWAVKGGGAIKSNGHYTAINADRLERPDLLANPNTRVVNMNQLGDALLDLQDPPVKFLFVYSSNPAIVAPDLNRVREGLRREDLFTVVHELFLTDTCRYADLVLPATSHFENMDLFGSYWHLYYQLHEPIIQPMGECKSNFTLFKELGLRMGFEAEAFDVTEEQMIREALDYPENPYLEGITFEKLRENGWMKAELRGSSLFQERIPTPSGRIELFSERMRLDGLPPVPAYSPVRDDDDRLPFLLVAGPNHSFLNSTFANQEKLKKLEKRPTLHMHKEDAAALGIETGDSVRVRNGRGEITIHVDVAENVLQGVLATQGLWWEKEGGGEAQSVNTLTSQRLADMGGGATFFSTRVEVIPT